MVRQDALTTSGLIVTIIFATILAAFLTTLFGMCIKSRRASRRMALQREAAMVSGAQGRNMRDVESTTSFVKGRGAGADAGASEAYLPLMAAQGPGGGRPGGPSREQSTDYASTRPAVQRGLSGGYQDVVPARVPVGGAQGLGAPRLVGMEGEEDDMGYGRGRQGR
jgi:hypothetical protein